MTYSGADLLVPAGIKCDGTSRHKQKHIYIGRVMKFGLFLGIFMSLKQFNVDIFILWVLWRYVWCFNILLMFGVDTLWTPCLEDYTFFSHLNIYKNIYISSSKPKQK